MLKKFVALLREWVNDEESFFLTMAMVVGLMTTALEIIVVGILMVNGVFEASFSRMTFVAAVVSLSLFAISLVQWCWWMTPQLYRGWRNRRDFRRAFGFSTPREWTEEYVESVHNILTREAMVLRGAFDAQDWINRYKNSTDAERKRVDRFVEQAKKGERTFYAKRDAARAVGVRVFDSWVPYSLGQLPTLDGIR